MKQTLPWLESVSCRPVWGPLGLIAIWVAGTAICVEPAHTAMDRYQRLQARHTLLVEQQTLHPLHAQVQIKSITERWAVLPMPAKKPLTSTETREAGSRLTRLMQDQGLEVKHLQPEVRAGTGSGRFLHVALITAGSFDYLTDACRALLALPSFAGVDRLFIQAESEERLTAEWSLWLEVE